MAHQCVRCGVVYESQSREILEGCTCGGKLFFFFSQEQAQKAKKNLAKLSPQDKDEIWKDVHELMRKEPEDPIVLDLESINIIGPGKYELNLVSLFKKQPVVYRIEDGKYLIDLAQPTTESKKK